MYIFYNNGMYVGRLSGQEATVFGKTRMKVIETLLAINQYQNDRR